MDKYLDSSDDNKKNVLKNYVSHFDAVWLYLMQMAVGSIFA